MEKAVDIRGLSVEFPVPKSDPVRALDGISLQVEPGAVVGFLGPNGAGKTTTLQAVLGFLQPTRGAARIFGRHASEPQARVRVGYLPEQVRWAPYATARELLCAFGRMFGYPRAECAERAAALLDEVGLTQAADRRLGGFSRGMSQRFGLAQALINEPDLLVLDEPTSGLDPMGRLSVRAIIERRNQRGVAVFFSSHELSEVERICDTVAILVRGRIAAEGRAEDLVQPGESLEQCFLRIAGGREES